MIIDDIDQLSETKNPWRLCSVKQVEEVKLVVQLIPIWLACLMFGAIITQLHTYYTKQASTLSRSIGQHFVIPPASLQGLVGIAILICVPIYDRIFIPIARKFTGRASGITILQRIGIGLGISILNTLVAASVEKKRVGVAAEHGLLDSPKAIVPMSLWWLLPQYLIGAVADVFTIVGLQELFYDQVPEEMRSFGAAAYISVTGFGSFLSNAIIAIVQAITARNGNVWLGNNLNRAYLDRFYWVLTGLSTVNLFIYVWITKGYKYKEVVDDEEGNWNREMKMRNDV